MTAPLKPGDKVRVVIDATVTDVRDDSHWSCLEYAYDSGHPAPFTGFAYTRSDAVTVRAVGMDDAPIDDLGFSVRVYNCLRRGGVKTVGQLTALSMVELFDIRNFGDGAAVEVREVLAERGLELHS